MAKNTPDTDKLLNYVKSNPGVSCTVARNYLGWTNKTKLNNALAKLNGVIHKKTGEKLFWIPQEEKDLWQPATAALNKNKCEVLSGRSHSQYLAINTATKKKPTGTVADGIWSNPDVTVVLYSRYKYLKHEDLEVVTLEIKHYSKGLNVTAVFEALAHRRAASHSYLLVFHKPSEIVDANLMSTITAEATRHGIGLIVTADMNAAESWDVKVKASKVALDYRLMEAFFDAKLTQDQQNSLHTLDANGLSPKGK